MPARLAAPHEPRLPTDGSTAPSIVRCGTAAVRKPDLFNPTLMIADRRGPLPAGRAATPSHRQPTPPHRGDFNAETRNV